MNFDLNSLKNMITNPEDFTDQYSYEDIQKNQMIAAATTIPCLFWLPLVVNKDSEYAKFYANQSLILTILCVVLSLLGKVLGKVLWMIPLLGHLLSSLLALVVTAVGVGAWVLLLISALQGKAKELPIIGNIIHPFK